MAVYMELRCELRGEGRSDETCCWSDENTGPWSMALDTKKSTAETTTEIFTMARDAGWKRINGDWVCPGCQENLAKVKQGQAAPDYLVSHNQ